MLARALEGEERAVRSMVELFTPIIQARVARILFSRFRRERDLGEAVADATQDVFAALFADGGRALRAWDPARGLSLQNFVGLVAERHALSNLRGGSRTGAREQSATDDELSEVGGADSGPESKVTRRMMFDAVIARVESELTEQGRRLFALLFVDELSIEAICAEVQMTPDAVYAWRSRLLKTVRRISTEIDDGASDPVPLPRTSNERGP
jgi:RNA polymerase sigma factor (sigma-70 family)